MSFKSLYGNEFENREIEFSEKLYSHPQWLGLGHYKQISRNNWLSEVDDWNFFISKKGMFSPKDELVESLKLIRQSAKDFYCKYPARYSFLKKFDSSLPEFEESNCPLLKKWRKNHTAQSISLVFPGPFMTSPSSIFGHTFLRFDNKGKPDSVALAVEFAAKVNYEEEGTFSFIRKGLTGGFKGFYTLKPYYSKIWEYNDIENREVWEYKLNLNADKTDLLLLHLWELKDHYFDYYFIDENCSYQILALLAVVEPELDFRSEFTNFVLPSETIKYLEKNNIIEGINYLPSHRERFQILFNQLNDDEAYILESIVNRGLDIDSPEFTRLADQRKDLILKTATHVIHHKIQMRSINQKEAIELINKFTRYRLSLKSKYQQNNFELPVRVEESHSPSRAGVSLSRYNDENYTNYSFRPALHSMIDPVGGFEKGTDIEILKIEVQEKNQDFELVNLTLLNLKTLIPDSIYSDNFSWGLEIATKKIYNNPDIDPVSHIIIDLGKSYKTGSITSYIFGNSGILYQSISGNNFGLQAGIKTGFIYQNEHLSFQLEALAVRLTNDNDLNYRKILGQFSYNLTKDFSFISSIQRIDSTIDKSVSYGLGLAWYY